MNGATAADLDLGAVTEPVVAGTGDRAVHGRRFDDPIDARAAGARALPNLAFHNLDALARLGDPRVGELVALPAGDGGFTARARFGGDGGCDRDWARLAEAWRRCTDRFGALDWDVAVYSSDHEWPRALAFPGVVLVSDRLDVEAAGTQWLYLLHELLHQWFGGLVRFAPDAAWEAWVDAIAWTVAAEVLGDRADTVYAAVYERQIRTGEPALAERGALVLAARRALRDEPDRLDRLADRTAEARARAGAGLPRTVAAAPTLNAEKGTPHAG
ncbi:M1 family metallopeptidase [Glycomyces paridis]|uniref:M1 family metallopeptidase n=1 Tax=Glycomyces paridis TaxID=2126555 RepID=A0A4S8PDA2_9ACTN|nr:M1 family metallopeptidase [Glycomyces paridis]THV28348.1 M1 family metallopeptidase [Glycomyces paridis]